MTLSLTKRQTRAWEEALTDRGTIASRTRRRLVIGNEDYSPILKTWRYAGEDGPAMVFEGVLAGRFSPESLEGENARLELLVGGVPFLAFTGEIVSARQDQPSYGYTEVSGASSSYHLEGTELPPTLRTFNSLPAEVALYEILSLLQGHGGYAGIEIPRFEGALFSRTEDEGFSLVDRAADVVEAIRNDSGLTFFDDGENVARGYVETSLDSPGEPVVDLVAGRDFDPLAYSREARFTERYSEVRVYRERELDGVEEILARSRVEGTRLMRSKPFDIKTEDPDTRRAQAQAYREALRLSTDLEDASLSVLYPIPHLTRGDTAAITTEERGVKKGRKGRYKHRRLMRVSQFEVTESKRMDLEGAQRQESEEFVADSWTFPRRPSEAPNRRPFGTDYLGRPYLSDELSWVFFDEATRTVAIDEAGALSAGLRAYYDQTTLELVLEEVS